MSKFYKSSLCKTCKRFFFVMFRFLWETAEKSQISFNFVESRGKSTTVYKISI